MAVRKETHTGALAGLCLLRCSSLQSFFYTAAAARITGTSAITLKYRTMVENDSGLDSKAGRDSLRLGWKDCIISHCKQGSISGLRAKPLTSSHHN